MVLKYAKDPKTQGVRDEDVIYEKQETRQGQEAIYMDRQKKQHGVFWAWEVNVEMKSRPEEEDCNKGSTGEIAVKAKSENKNKIKNNRQWGSGLGKPSKRGVAD